MRISVAQDDLGKRLDRFLQESVFFDAQITRGEIIRIIKSGSVRVNDRKVKPSHSIKAGDDIEILSESRRVDDEPLPNKQLELGVIFENKDFLVIDKPAGIQVHPDAHEKTDTVANWLVAKYPEIKNVHDGSRGAELRPGIVHRLDKDTSGLMVVALNQRTFKQLKRMFQNRTVKKAYLAIVHGRLAEKSGVIEKTIARAANYKKQVIASTRTRTKLRPAMTEYRVKKEFQGYSLIEASPKTGRTHQIRIHLWSIGHPIVGDALYKPKKNENRYSGIKRQLLHAAYLAFELDGQRFEFRSTMPEDLQTLVTK